MSSTAKVVLDSVSLSGKRIVTMQLRYPRFVHAELMTHRVFSRNASSSRAIPVAKMIKQVREEPAMPIHWGKNQSGMQAREELTGADKEHVVANWIWAANRAADFAEEMMKSGAHKQVANRILEPFQYISVIVTSTEWDNWDELRDHADAEPNIQDLARKMKAARDASTPTVLDHGAWHLPYVTDDDRRSGVPFETLIKCSVARCARVSYLTHDGDMPSIEKDVALYEQLVGSRPLHASPTEHQARPWMHWNDPEFLQGNFKGWSQYRKFIEVGRPIF